MTELTFCLIMKHFHTSSNDAVDKFLPRDSAVSISVLTTEHIHDS